METIIVIETKEAVGEEDTKNKNVSSKQCNSGPKGKKINLQI